MLLPFLGRPVQRHAAACYVILDGDLIIARVHGGAMNNLPLVPREQGPQAARVPIDG